MNNIARRTLLLVWIALAAPLFASSPEYLIGDTVTTAAPEYRTSAQIATDGTDFFAVWVDYRTPGVSAVIGTRITRNGQVVDPVGIRIAAVAGALGAVHVVWDGAAWLVVWSSDWNVNAARVDRDGHTIMQPRVLRTNAAVPWDNVVASNGTNTAIAYYSYVNWVQVPGIRILTIDREANEVRETAIPTTAATTSYALAATQSRFLFAWSSSTGGWGEAVLDAVALKADGELAAGPKRLGPGSSPEIATNGTNFLVVAPNIDRKGEPWTFDARALTPALAQIGDTETLTSGWEPTALSVLWRRGRYEVLLTRRAEPSTSLEAFIFELEPDADVIASHPRNHWTGRTVTNGQEAVALFSIAGPSIHIRIFARIYRDSLQTYDAVRRLSSSGNGHTNPVIAASDSGHLVAWDEIEGVFATRVDAQGRSLDGRGILLGQFGRGVRVAFDGTNYVAAWLEHGAAAVRRIDPATGSTVAEVRMPASVWATGVAVAASTEATYVVIGEAPVRVVRIPHATQIPDPVPALVSPENEPVQEPAAAWNGSMLLVVWNDEMDSRAGPPIHHLFRTLGARLTGDLTLLDPAPLVIARAQQESDLAGAPSVATNGDDWLVVLSTNQADVLARRVRSDGTLDGNDAERIAGGADAAVTWDGTRYAVAWKDQAGVRLGALPAEGPLTLARQTPVMANPAPSPLSVARAANGEIAVLYTKVSFRPEHAGVERTFLRFMDFVTLRGRVVRR